MKRGFTILFIELFCVQASLFLGALLQEYALFCQIMLLFFLALTYRKDGVDQAVLTDGVETFPLKIDLCENGITIWKTIFFH